MLQVMVYALAISAVLGVIGLCEEKLATMLGRSRRFIWAAAMVLSILWPLGMVLWARPEEVASPVAMRAQLPRPAIITVEPAAPIAAARPGDEAPQDEAAVSAPAPVRESMQAPDSWMPAPPSNRTLLSVWAALSAAMLLHFAIAEVMLHHRAVRWRRVTMMGRQVLVSDRTGPALLGAWRPKPVVPRWFLDEPAATQSLILEHEQQHIAARDPLLLRAALLIVALMPWNLPLWWQLRRLRQAIELDCDARVLRGGAEPGAYGEVLLAVTQRAGSVPAGALAMSEPVSALERRIRHLTAGPARYSAPRALAALTLWGLGIGAGFALEAPPLPRSPQKVAVANPAPALSPQVQEVSPPPAMEAVPPAPRVSTPSQPKVDFAAQWNQVKRNCVKCHNGTDWAAGIDFESMRFDAPGSDAKAWEAAVRRLRTGSMPPATEQRPDQQAVLSVVGVLETRLDAAHLQAHGEESNAANARKLDGMELASRLSQFLWGSSADDQLLQAAARGKLDEPGQLAAQIRRMLADPKAMSLVVNFGSRWLDLARMDEVGSAAPEVRPLLKREMELFLDSVLRGNQPVMALMTADYTYLNEALATHYGVASVQGEEFRRVTLRDSRRHGLLGKGAVLMVTSMPDRSSPSLRGSWILNRILGMPQYKRPPGVGVLADSADVNPAGLRERLAQHVKNKSCFACHGLMDPLGFALENFDAVGRLRERDAATGDAVDTTGTLPDGTHLTGPDDLRRTLMTHPEQFVQTVTEQLMAYALGREVDWQDMPAVRQIVRNAAKDKYRFASIVSQVAASDAFRHGGEPE